MICLTDLFATVAQIADAELPKASAEDSVSFLPALSGDEIESTQLVKARPEISSLACDLQSVP